MLIVLSACGQRETLSRGSLRKGSRFLDKKPERASVLMNLKEKCDAPECNPTVCRKARDEHEL